jgi:capsular polysaccharide transport system permease protein
MSSILSPKRLLRRRQSDGISAPGVVATPAFGAIVEEDGGRRTNEAPSVPTFAGTQARRKIPWIGLSFTAFVVVPAILTVVYYAFIASPQYAAEARLVVRTAEVLLTDTVNPLSSSGATSNSSSQIALTTPTGLSEKYPLPLQNAYIVSQYIRSQAILADLSKTLDLHQIFGRPEADFLARLPSGASGEELLDYWQRMVRSYVDGPSAIVTFQVRAFRPDDALKLADEINRLSERLVNEISSRSRQDIMRASEEEVRQADAQLRLALQELQIARDAEGILDPGKAAEDTSKLLLQLTGERIRLEAEFMAASRSLDANAPSVRYLRSRVEILDGQIKNLKASLAGNGGAARNIAASLRRFEELDRNRFVAEKLLTVAEESLSRARKRAERQNLYFMVFVPPALPTDAEYPERLNYSILLPLAFLILWGIGALAFAAIEDHRA